MGNQPSTSPRAPSPCTPRRRVLAFGDSLTEGYVTSTSFAPYSDHLRTLLNANITHAELSSAAASRSVAVDNYGVSGDFATAMPDRLHLVLRKAQEVGAPYDLVIVLAGTNDLGCDGSVDDIFGSLTRMYAEVLAHHSRSAHLLLVTVPEARMTFSEGYTRARTGLNERIRDFHAEHVDQRTHLLDLDKVIPYSSVRKTDREAEFLPLWSDTLHFSALGYERVACLLYAVIREECVLERESRESDV
jgi:lysophospholipase L1-like esterase